MDFKINQQERDALKGLMYLPRLTYLEALRPYMDYKTGIVGIMRGISYQSLREELYVETQRGHTGGSPSRQQMRRVVTTLERAGLIHIQSEEKKLILKCVLATCDSLDQNLLGRRPTHAADTARNKKNIHLSGDCSKINSLPDTSKNALTDIPPESGINIIFLKHAFEKFWLMYPNKQSKIRAWEIFHALSPTPEMFDVILNALKKQCDLYNIAVANGQWVPNWKNAGNWLIQRCWSEPLFETQQTGNHHARITRNNSKQSQSRDLIWESYQNSLKREDDDQQSGTVVNIGEYRHSTR